MTASDIVIDKHGAEHGDTSFETNEENNKDSSNKSTAKNFLIGQLYMKSPYRWRRRVVTLDLKDHSICIYKLNGKADDDNSVDTHKSSKRSELVERYDNSCNSMKSVRKIPGTTDWKMIDVKNNSFLFSVQIPHGTTDHGNERAAEKIWFKCVDGTYEKPLWLDTAARMNKCARENVQTNLGTFLKLRKHWGQRRVARDNENYYVEQHRKLSLIERKERSPSQNKESMLYNNMHSLDLEGLRSPDEKEYEVKPRYCYPHRWMTLKEMQKECLRRSMTFHDLRSPGGGEIGSLHIEVLSCQGLPSLDALGKNDSVVYLVLGSFVFRTDIIHDANEPMWLRRTKRACILPVFHAYSELFASVMDYDGEKDNDDFAGRVVISICKLRPGTLYDVTLPLRLSSHVCSNDKRGVIRLRFKLEWNDARRAVLSYLPFDKFRNESNAITVRCGDKKSFRNVAVTVHGRDLPGIFSNKKTVALKRELKIYKIMSPFIIEQEFENLINWVYPKLSFLAFAGWMHSIYANSIALVPPYCVLILIGILLRNYNSDEVRKGSCEFESLYLSDIFWSLLLNKKDDSTYYMKPLNTKNATPSSTYQIDHMEFPFSQHETNPKRTSLESYAVDDTYDNEDDDEDEDEELDVDIHMSEHVDGYDTEEEELRGLSQNSSKKRPDKPLPTQDVRVRVPSPTFYEDIEEIRDKLHSSSNHIFRNPIFVSNDENSNTSSAGKNGECVLGILKEEKALNIKPFKNPIKRTKALYIGPMLHIIQIGLVAYRTCFNAFMWKDPYMSFWLLILLLLVFGVLLLFPWRIFFFIIGMIMLGPQNWFNKTWKKDPTDECIEERSTSKNDGHAKSDPILSTPSNEIRMMRRKTFDGSHYLNKKFSKLGAPAVWWKTPNNVSHTEDAVYNVVVPDSPLSFQRFYDWPPILSASKAITVSSLEKDEPDILPESNMKSKQT